MELDHIETTSKASKGNNYLLPVVAIIVVLGVRLYFIKHFRGMSDSKPVVDTNYSPYVDFAENFVIAFNNISYVNQDQQRAAFADMMSSDLLTSYQNNFYDPQFLKMVTR